MKDLYVEIRPCSKTIRDTDYTKYSFLPLGNVIHFVNKKAEKFGFILSDDYKFIIGYYKGMVTMYRVTNISSKEITFKNNVIMEYKRLQKEIDRLKAEQKNIVLRKRLLNAIKS